MGCHSPNYFYIYYDMISEDEKITDEESRIQRGFRPCRFIKYESLVSLSFYQVSSSKYCSILIISVSDTPLPYSQQLLRTSFLSIVDLFNLNHNISSLLSIVLIGCFLRCFTTGDKTVHRYLIILQIYLSFDLIILIISII